MIAWTRLTLTLYVQYIACLVPSTFVPPAPISDYSVSLSQLQSTTRQPQTSAYASRMTGITLQLDTLKIVGTLAWQLVTRSWTWLLSHRASGYSSFRRDARHRKQELRGESPTVSQYILACLKPGTHYAHVTWAHIKPFIFNSFPIPSRALALISWSI